MRESLPLFCRIALILGACASTAAGQQIAGRVVDSMGNGVDSVDIDAEDVISGMEVSLNNDTTDVNGDFLTDLPQSGLYRITFRPPPPPVTTHLFLEVDNVVVTTVTNLGTLALPRGVSLSGRAVNAGSNPVQGVNVDVIDNSTGLEILLQGDNTNAFGQFHIAVPPNSIEVQFKTDNTGLPLLAPRSLSLFPAANTVLGDVTLQPGFAVTGTVRDGSSSPVQGVDLDVESSSTGEKLFTPGDNTDSLGRFSVVVPAGTWDFEACPRPADLLVGSVWAAAAINSSVDLGTVNLQNGVVLSGTITDSLGPVAGADVDVAVSGSGVEVVLCGDNTNAAGFYSVLVPNGTFDIVFSRPEQPACSVDAHPSFVVSGNTVLNGMLPDCFCFANTNCPAELPGDPTLTDTGGDANIGPKLGNAIEPFNLALDCSGAGAPGVYSITLRANKLAVPVALRFGLLWGSGPRFLKCAGAHTLGAVECGAVVLPLDVSLLGVSYTAQGFCTGTNLRLSNAIGQRVGQ